MGCSRCVQLVLVYPEITQWGTIAWTLLHGMAERTAKLGNPANIPFAKNQWIFLLDSLPKIIPCPECQVHAADWIKAHPVGVLKTLPDTQMYPWLAVWLYEFHEAVNARLGKPSFPFGALQAKYAGVNVRSFLNDLRIHIETAVKITGTGLIAWKKWVSSISLLMSYCEV
jgi:Erv1 / Alr family